MVDSIKVYLPNGVAQYKMTKEQIKQIKGPQTPPVYQ